MRILRSTSVQKPPPPPPPPLPGDPGIVGANANRPSVDRFLDFIAVVEDLPVHAAMLAYLRRRVQLEMASVGLDADWGASCIALQAAGRLSGARARRTRSRERRERCRLEREAMVSWKLVLDFYLR